MNLWCKRVLGVAISLVAISGSAYAVPPITDTATPTATPTPSMTTTPSPTVTTTADCSAVFGCGACVNNGGSGSGNPQILVGQYVLSGDGTVRSIEVSFTASAGSGVRAGIYSDVANNPGVLLVESLPQTATTGWNTIPINPTFLSAGTYWIAVLSEGNNNFPEQNISSRRYLIYDLTYGPMPSNVLSAPAYNIYFSASNRPLFRANYCAGPPIFFTPTPTPTATPTPVQYLATNDSKLLLGPVPARKGEPVCLYFDQAPRSSTWEVYNLRGQQVSTASFALGAQACWETRNIAPGLYFVRAKVEYLNGGSKTVSQKVVVLP